MRVDKVCGVFVALLGLLIIVGGFMVFKGAIPKAIDAAFKGGYRGSMAHICSDKGDAIEKFTSVDFAEATPSYTDYYFFSIQNPKEYVRGADAELAERGPYVLRKYTVNHDVSFKPSTISVDTDNEYGAIEYKTASVYVVLDKETHLTTNLELDKDDLSLSWSDDERSEIPKLERKMPGHLSMSDQVVNLSPGYLITLSATTNEVVMALSFQCTPAQIANIASANPTDGKAQCSPSAMGDLSDGSDCACCMLDDTYHRLGEPSPYVNCNTLYDDESGVMSTISLLAAYDGGVAIKEVGEDPPAQKFDGSGDAFNGTLFGQQTFHTPLIQSHSVNDRMFGYPSAFAGRSIAGATITPTHKAMVDAGATVTKTEVALQILNGLMDESLPIKVGNLAKYTTDVGNVCSSTCVGTAAPDPLAESPIGWWCTGTAPERHETRVMDEIALGGIDCRPYSSTFATKMYCGRIASALVADPAASGYSACVCADADDDWSDSGCCLAGGELSGFDLTGNGCLMPIPGSVDANYVGKDSPADPGVAKVDIGRAMEAYMEREEKKKSTMFMCPAQGVALAEHDLFGSYESYEEETHYITFHDTGNSRARPGDALVDSAVAYNATVVGGAGSVMKAAGLTAQGGARLISNGVPSNSSRLVYIGAAKRPFEFRHNTTSKVCGSLTTCVPTARFTQFENLSPNSEDALAKGQGLPYDGVQTLAHLTGVPVYLHQPFFLDGDEELLSQQNNTHVQLAVPGNGIKLYRQGTKYRQKEETADPGSFASGSYELVDKSWVDENREHLETFLDVEPSTGLTLSAGIRFSTSFSTWECNPETNPSCLLAATSKGQSKCYSQFGEDFFNGLDASWKTSFNAAGRNDWTYPCSAANLLTPDLVAGKLIPMVWFDSETTGKPGDIDKLILVGAAYKQTQTWFILSFFFGFTIWFSGCFLCCIRESKSQTVVAMT